MNMAERSRTGRDLCLRPSMRQFQFGAQAESDYISTPVAIRIRWGIPTARRLSFFFNDTATTEIYTLSLHDALPISPAGPMTRRAAEVMQARGLERKVRQPHDLPAIQVLHGRLVLETAALQEQHLTV